jgi:hypothetical protein
LKENIYDHHKSKYNSPTTDKNIDFGKTWLRNQFFDCISFYKYSDSSEYCNLSEFLSKNDPILKLYTKLKDSKTKSQIFFTQ